MGSRTFTFQTAYKTAKNFYVVGNGDEVRRHMLKYDHAIDMWHGEINWHQIISLLSTQCQGSKTEADEISRCLTLFKRIASGDQSVFNTAMYQQYLQDPAFQAFLAKLGPISTWFAPTNKEQGDIFEKFIDNAVSAASEAIGNGAVSGWSGNNMVRSQSRIGAVIINIPQGESIYTVNDKGQLEIAQSIRNRVKEQLGLMNSRLKNQVEIREVQRDKTNSICAVDVRLGFSKQQKSDLDYSLLIKVQDTGELSRFLNLIAGTNLSVKSYNFGDSSTSPNTKSVDFGHTNIYRKYSAFYYAASWRGGANGADAGTFCYATDNSSTVLPSYKKWVDFLYEMLGIGQQTSGKLVDYVIINNAGSITDTIMVRSIKEELNNLTLMSFEQDPPFILSNSGSLPVRRSAGGSSFDFSR